MGSFTRMLGITWAILLAAAIGCGGDSTSSNPPSTAEDAEFLERAGFPPLKIGSEGRPVLRMVSPDSVVGADSDQPRATIKLAAAAQSSTIEIEAWLNDTKYRPAKVDIQPVIFPADRAAVPTKKDIAVVPVNHWWVTIAVDLHDGENHVECRIVDGAGRSSNSEVVRITRWETPGVVHALCIGINDYADSRITDLAVAENDARAVAEFFQSPSGGAAGRTKTLIGATASRREIIDGFQFLAKAAPQDTVIFYFAGHGMKEGDSTFLVPQDAQVERLKLTGLPVDDIREMWSSVAARRKVFIADSCNSGAFRGIRDAERIDFERLFDGTGTANFLAAKADQTAKERSELGHGLFTWNLLKALQGRADTNNDGIVTLGELQQDLLMTVPTDARALGTLQNPVIVLDTNGLVPISRLRATPTKPPTENLSTPPPTQPSSGRAPVIRIQTPTTGAWLRETKFVVAGIVEPPQSPDTPLRVQGNAVTFNGTAFTAIVDLREGRDQTVRMEVGTPGPGYAVATITVHIDTTAPRIRLDSPAADFITNASTITVAGSCTEADAELRVNGALVPMRAGQFSTDLPLQSGRNEFTITARDRAGNDAPPISRTVIVKRTAPRIEVLEPANGGLVGATPVTVRGLIDDPDVAKVSINGRDVAVSSGQFRTTIAVADGRTTITVTGRDRAGNEGRATAQIEVDLSPPRITIEKPGNGATVEAADVEVAGRVDDLQATLTIAGRAVPLAGDGRFSQSVPLQVGRNEIAVAARDRLGRTTPQTLTITRRDATPTPPANENRPTVAGYTWLREETFSCGGQTHTMQVYRCDKFAQLVNARTETRNGKQYCDVDCEFVLIPAGEFMMGSPAGETGRGSDEGPQHRVRFAKPFLMARTEVSQRVWQAVMGNNPAYFKNGQNGAPSDSSRLPVENVSWNDITGANGFNARAGLTGLRLPSEAEWEYACRAGTTTRFQFGDSEGDLSNYAWFSGNAGSETHAVGEKRANAFGLYDMHGNVWEWCQDDWQDNYDGAPTDGSARSVAGASYRVIRGGSWFSGAVGCRSAVRVGYVPGGRSSDLGFRPVQALSD